MGNDRLIHLPLRMEQISTLLALALWTASGIQAKPVNIVFLLTDDQASYSLGCYGNRDVRTPHIDRLAAEGISFRRHYNSTAICMASRATIVSGMYEYKHGCNFNHGPLLEEHWQRSYPMRLREAGYMTAFAGKIGFEVKRAATGKKVLPEDDFDRWGGGPGQTSYKTANNKSMAHYAKDYPHSSRSYGAFGRDFIQAAAAAGRPFCLSISFKAPHKPDQPDPMFDHVYARQSFTKPANFGREHGEHFSEQSRQGRQYERFISWGYRDRYDEVMALYHQLIYGVDVAVGMIRSAVEAAGLADNTVFIFTSDNGFFCGSHGYGSKVLPYEEASSVPLIIYDPRHPHSGKGFQCRSLTGNIDIAPTILALAGLAPTANMDGRNLMTLYDDPNEHIHDHLALINVWGPQAVQSLGIVTQDYKYIWWPYAGNGFRATEELYSITTDPLELENLARGGDSNAVCRQLQATYDQALARWRKESVDYHGYREYGQFFDRSYTWKP